MEERIKVLAVDDEPDLLQLLQIHLHNRGYDVKTASNGAEAVEWIRTDPNFDLVIMDIMMPGVDGVTACGQIREFSPVPVLFLTAKSKQTDKQEAYENGGDDYLVKPFSREELLMKVESLIRRYRIYRGKREALGEEKLVLDEERGAVIKGEQTIDLTDKEYSILRFFFYNRGKTLDVQTLYENVWGEKFMASSNNTVMVHILNLRKKLEEDPANPKILKTVWGKGYRFG